MMVLSSVWPNPYEFCARCNTPGVTRVTHFERRTALVTIFVLRKAGAHSPAGVEDDGAKRDEVIRDHLDESILGLSAVDETARC
jgi:hypothetical protein